MSNESGLSNRIDYRAVYDPRENPTNAWHQFEVSDWDSVNSIRTHRRYKFYPRLDSCSSRTCTLQWRAGRGTLYTQSMRRTRPKYAHMYHANASSRTWAPQRKKGDTTPGLNHVPIPGYASIRWHVHHSRQTGTNLVITKLLIEVIFLQ